MSERSIYMPYLLMTISASLRTIVHLSVKNLNQTFDTFHIMAFMFNTILVLRIIYYYYFQQKKDLFMQIRTSKAFMMVIFRHTLASISMGLLLLSIRYIPLGIANSIFNMTPIFIHFLQALFYKKSINYKHFLLTITSFIGVICIIQPQFIFGTSSSSINKFYVFVALISAILNSFSMLLISQIKNQGVSQTTVLQLYVFFQGLFGSVLANFQTFQGSMQIIEGWMLLQASVMVFFNIICQILLYKALYLGQTSLILPFSYANIISSILIDLYYFGQQMSIINVFGILLTSVGLISKLIIS